MKKLRTANPIWHAIAWVAAYILLVGIGDAVSEAMGEPNSATTPLVLILALVLFLYVKRNHWGDYYGLHRFNREQFNATLYYAPLVILIALQFLRGIRTDLTPMVVVLVVGLMIGVGFIEELLFRGFLFRAILRKATLTRAVVISGLTFGIGHIVNLGRGYTGSEQILQIGVAIALGIVLVLLYAVSGTIIPLIAFHVLFNIGGNLTVDSVQFDFALLVVTVIISAGYGAYLLTVLRVRGLHSSLREADPIDPVPAVLEGHRP